MTKIGENEVNNIEKFNRICKKIKEGEPCTFVVEDMETFYEIYHTNNNAEFHERGVELDKIRYNEREEHFEYGKFGVLKEGDQVVALPNAFLDME